MAEEKKYVVDVEVDMCYARHVKATVTAANEEDARRKAKEECLEFGYYYAVPMGCTQIEEVNANENYHDDSNQKAN